MTAAPATSTTHLYVALHVDAAPTSEGTAEFNAVRGGPNQLLAWLENQLGLHGPDVPFTDRIVQHLRRFEAVPAASYEQSLNVDRWSTAEDCSSAATNSGWPAGTARKPTYSPPRFATSPEPKPSAVPSTPEYQNDSMPFYTRSTTTAACHPMS